MQKQKLHRIFSFLLLVIILTPVSIQFVHSFEIHTYHKIFSDDLDHIQNAEKDCAVFHNKINHNVIDLNFNFELKNFPFFNDDVQIIISETQQKFIKLNSSRAPPIPFV